MVWQEINIDNTYKYDALQYPQSGLYLVTDTTLPNKEFVLVNKEANITVFIGCEFDWTTVIERSAGSTTTNEITLLKLQLLKLTDSIEEQEYKQILAMLACGNPTDKLMAEDTIKTLLNTKA